MTCVDTRHLQGLRAIKRARRRNVASFGLGMDLSLGGRPPSGGGGGGFTPINGDLIALEVLGPTAVVTNPTNTIAPDGRVIAMTFKGMAAGLTRDSTKVSFTVTYPGFDTSGVATTVTETVYLNAWMRMPFPKAWVTSTTYVAGDERSNRVSSKGNIYRCVTAGGGASTTAPTFVTDGVTIGPGAEVTLADGYRWRYLGNPTDTTPPYTKLIETVSGSDIIVYGIPSQSIPASATIDSVTLLANAYGTSNAVSYTRAAEPIRFTHSQTILALQPMIAPITQRRQLVTSSIRIETVVYAHGAQNRRPVELHRFKIYNSAGTLMLTQDVTAVSRSQIATATANIVQVMGFTLDLSNNVTWPDDTYYVQEESYPRRGRAFISETHGYGYNLASRSTTAALVANCPKTWYFQKIASPTIRYAYVDGGAGTGAAISTVAATARLTPYADIRTALLALQTANGGTVDGKLVVRIMDKGSVYSNGMSNATGLQTGFTWGATTATIEIDPLATPGSVEYAPTSLLATANRTGPQRMRWSGLKFTASASTPAIDNVINGTIGELYCENWFYDCTMTSSGSQNPTARFGIHGFVNCTLGVSGNFGAAGRAALLYALSCNVLGGSIAANHSFGCVFTSSLPGTTASGNIAATLATLWAEGTGSSSTAVPLEYQLAGFHSWPKSTGSSGGPTPMLGTLTRGGAFFMSLVEVTDLGVAGSDSKGGTISGDGSTVPIAECHISNLSVVGEGSNICYNDAGFAEKHLYGGLNWFDDINHKGDYYDPTTASEAKIGNYIVRNHQDFDRNFIPGRIAAGSFNPALSAANNAGEAKGPHDVYQASGGPALDATVVLPRANGYPITTGGGDYHPTGSNASIGMVTSRDLEMFPEDLTGTAWVDGDAVGCFAKV